MQTQKYSKGVFLYLLHHKNRKSLMKQIAFIKSLPDVNHVEVWVEENIKPVEIKFLKSSLKNYSILIHAPWIHLSLISPHPEVRDLTVKLYIQTLKIADTLKAKLVTFHCGGKTIYDSKEETEKRFIQNFNKVRKLYKGNTPFTIENVPAKQRGPQISYPDFPTDLAILKKRAPWLKFSLDIGHILETGRSLDSVYRFLKKYKKSVLNIHLHDAILKGEAHLVLGKGDLDFNKLFQILNKVDYRGYVSLETISREDTKKSWGKIYKL